jgi:hypothetical protein
MPSTADEHVEDITEQYATAKDEVTHTLGTIQGKYRLLTRF